MPGNPSSAGKIIITAVIVSLLVAAWLLPAAAARSGTVTRGGTFTISVVGTPRTAYDVWPRGTSDMSGEPGDQPPVIVPGQVDVGQDPPGGPYLIGSHPASGGGTIREDVPPDSSTTPATSYYAEVTTDAGGHGVVLFRTSAATATDRQFHIVAGNPADPGADVPVFLGGIPASAPTSVMPPPLPMTLETPFVPLATTALPTVTAAPPVPVRTTSPLITPSPGETPTETGPVQDIPLHGFTAPVAAGIGLLLAGGAAGMKRRGEHPVLQDRRP